MPDEPTLGEVTRRLDAIASRLESIADSLTTDYVRKETFDLAIEALKEKFDKHDNWFNWIVKTAGAVIITGLLMLLIYKGGR